MKPKKLVVCFLLMFALSSCLLTRLYTLKLEPRELVIKQGATATLNLSYDYGISIYGPAALRVSLENPPPGVTAEPVTFGFGERKSEPMTITVTNDAALGKYSIELWLRPYSNNNDLADQKSLELTIVPAD